MQDADLYYVREIIHAIDAYHSKTKTDIQGWLNNRMEDPGFQGAAKSYLSLLYREIGLRPGKNIFDIVDGGYYKVPHNCQITNYPAICEQLFGCKNNGIFFETGAFDGESFSNTSFLADIGWRGVYLEPIQEFYDLCRLRHRVNPNVTVLQGAAGADFGSLEIHLALMASTANSEMFAEVSKLDFAKEFASPTVRHTWSFPLNFVFEQAKLPERFDLLVLDIEGFEYQALQGLDLNRWKPDVVIIELHDQHSDLASNPTLLENARNCRTIIEAHYEEFLVDNENSIYVRR